MVLTPLYALASAKNRCPALFAFHEESKQHVGVVIFHAHRRCIDYLRGSCVIGGMWDHPATGRRQFRQTLDPVPGMPSGRSSKNLYPQ